MIAIRLSKKNRAKILEASPIDPARLDQMIEEYDTPYGVQALFFVPQSDVAHSTDASSWMTLPWRALQSFKYDADKINTQFVEITHR